MAKGRHSRVVQVGAFVLLSIVVGACSSETSTSAVQALVTSPGSATTTTSPSSQTEQVPDVVGQSLAKASSQLKDLGFAPSVNKVYSTRPSGQVISSSPHPDSKTVVGTTIILTVAKAIPKVPNVIGLSTAAAAVRLKAAGYKVVVKKQASSRVVGHVISTNPSPRTPRVPNKTVVITVAKPVPSASAGSSGANCDPNYSGCVPIASDVDCAGGSGDGPAYVSGPVTVIGSDTYGLDSDNDGIGCE